MDFSLPGSSVHGIVQARVLECTKAGGGFDWALGEELADSWAIVSEKRGWWGEVVFTLLLAGDVFRNGTHHP